MDYLLGTDEAGYGPNLGPLVVSATVWEAPDGTRPGDLYRLLGQAVVESLAEARRPGAVRVAVADSKRLYPSPQGLRHLERGVLGMLAALGRRPATAWEVWQAIAPDDYACRTQIPWYADFDRPVPVGAQPAEIEAAGSALSTAMAAAGVRLTAVRSRALFEGPFNQHVERYGNKGTVLSHLTLGLAADACRTLPGAASVVCDKHGGRNAYRHLLAEHFPQRLIEVHGEGPQRSVYRFGPRDGRREFTFQVHAESFLATALASMVSKYLRELAMESFNAFWCARVPGLRRTAGYPADARRFKAEIAAVQAELGIEDRCLWRER